MKTYKASHMIKSEDLNHHQTLMNRAVRRPMASGWTKQTEKRS